MTELSSFFASSTMRRLGLFFLSMIAVLMSSLLDMVNQMNNILVGKSVAVNAVLQASSSDCVQRMKRQQQHLPWGFFGLRLRPVSGYSFRLQFPAPSFGFRFQVLRDICTGRESDLKFTRRTIYSDTVDLKYLLFK